MPELSLRSIVHYHSGALYITVQEPVHYHPGTFQEISFMSLAHYRSGAFLT